MEVLYPHCAGLDAHKGLPSRKRGQTVVACARHMVNGTLTREVRRFGTTTKDLPGLSEWLASQGCTHRAFRPRHDRGSDRRRHDPLSQRGTPALLGRFLSPK